jgi:hypothetical protein
VNTATFGIVISAATRYYNVYAAFPDEEEGGYTVSPWKRKREEKQTGKRKRG